MKDAPKVSRIIKLELRPLPMPLTAQQQGTLATINEVGRSIGRARSLLADAMDMMAMLYAACSCEVHQFAPNPDQPAGCEACGQTRDEPIHGVKEKGR